MLWHIYVYIFANEHRAVLFWSSLSKGTGVPPTPTPQRLHTQLCGSLYTVHVHAQLTHDVDFSCFGVSLTKFIISDFTLRERANLKIILFRICRRKVMKIQISTEFVGLRGLFTDLHNLKRLAAARI